MPDPTLLGPPAKQRVRLPRSNRLTTTTTSSATTTTPFTLVNPVPSFSEAKTQPVPAFSSSASPSVATSAARSSTTTVQGTRPRKSPRGTTGSDRLSSLAAFVSEKTHSLGHRASFSTSIATLPTSSPSTQPKQNRTRTRTRNSLLTTTATISSDSQTPVAIFYHAVTAGDEPQVGPAIAASQSSLARLNSAPVSRTTLAPFLPEKPSSRDLDITSSKKHKKSISTESLLDSSADSSNLHETKDTVSTDISARQKSKMHQTSSRLLRMTDDDRPFTRDFKDLFSTLMVSLPLTMHRFRFKAYQFSFASEEAINNLGSLKFSQSNRMPDPKDSSRIVTTTTTTTFSMAKEMARSVCQRFMDARFIELADGKTIQQFPLKGCLWQLTPKGIHILERFCQRNGIQQDHVLKLLNSPFNTMRLVILERDLTTDKLSHDKTTTEVIFRRFAGPTPNIKNSVAVSDSDSVSDYQDGQTGVKLAENRKIYDRVLLKMSFTGKCAVDWLLDCCTTVERSETHEIVNLFLHYGLIQSVLEDKVYIQQNPKGKDFQPTKNAVYIITEKGQRIAGWIEPDRTSLGDRNGEINANCISTSLATSTVRNRGSGSPRGHHQDQRETNTTRLQAILNDAALRLLYREFLRETVCEENLTFYLDVAEFNKNFQAIDMSKSDAVRETLAAAYGLYNAFLAPGSPCELNIDHPLRQDMASRMTRAVAKDETSMYTSLKEVASLFDRAQQQVFKLMAGDSVPKFIRTHKYIEVAGDILDDERLASGQSGLHRSGSRRYGDAR